MQSFASENHAGIYTSDTMLSSGILRNILRVTCVFLYTHESLASEASVYVKKIQVASGIFHSMPLETNV